MKVLLLGATGFIGSAIPLQRPNWNWTLCNSATFDLTNFSGTLDYHDVIINCAGFYGGLPFNQMHGSEIVAENAKMFATIDRLVREIKPRKTIGIGTGCMYPGNSKDIMSESLVDTGPYHNSVFYSGIAKRLSLDYLRQLPSDLGWEFLIMSNVYGPGEPTDPKKSHVVGSLISKFLKGDTHLMGTGKGIRDFFYITDAAEAICRYAECPATNSHTNISSGKGTVIQELADAIANATGVDNITWSNNPDQDGVPVKILDNSKMQKDIGIWDYIPIKQGIEKTVNHIKEKG